MASRKEQKEEARRQREALQEQQATDAKRRQRLWIVGGVLGIAVIVVAVAIAVSSGSGTSTASTNNFVAAAKTVNQELSGLQQSGNTLGSPSAPVKIAFYGDLECPICQEFALGSFTQLLSNDIAQGRVQISYNALETATHDPNVFAEQQAAALAAGKQNKMWNYVETFYKTQGQEDTGYVNTQWLTGIAQAIATASGLNYSQWSTERNDPALATQVQQQQQTAANNGFDSTPTLVVSGPKGQQQPIVGPPTYQQLEQTIQAAA